MKAIRYILLKFRTHFAEKEIFCFVKQSRYSNIRYVDCYRLYSAWQDENVRSELIAFHTCC